MPCSNVGCWDIIDPLTGVSCVQVGASYARQAGEAGMGQQSRTSQLLEQGKMPQDGWQDRSGGGASYCSQIWFILWSGLDSFIGPRPDSFLPSDQLINF